MARSRPDPESARLQVRLAQCVTTSLKRSSDESIPFCGRPRPVRRAVTRSRPAPRQRLSANPAHPLDVRKSREAEVGAQPELGPDRLGDGASRRRRPCRSRAPRAPPSSPGPSRPSPDPAGRGRSGRRRPRPGRRGSRGCCPQHQVVSRGDRVVAGLAGASAGRTARGRTAGRRRPRRRSAPARRGWSNPSSAGSRV